MLTQPAIGLWLSLGLGEASKREETTWLGVTEKPRLSHPQWRNDGESW